MTGRHWPEESKNKSLAPARQPMPGNVPGRYAFSLGVVSLWSKFMPSSRIVVLKRDLSIDALAWTVCSTGDTAQLSLFP